MMFADLTNKKPLPKWLQGPARWIGRAARAATQKPDPFEEDFTPWGGSDDFLDGLTQDVYLVLGLSVLTAFLVYGGYFVIWQSLLHGGLANATAYWLAAAAAQMCSAGGGLSCSLDIILTGLLVGVLMVLTVVFWGIRLVSGFTGPLTISQHESRVHQHLQLVNERLEVLYEKLKEQPDETETLLRGVLDEYRTATETPATVLTWTEAPGLPEEIANAHTQSR